MKLPGNRVNHTKGYHIVIFLSAVLVLLIGGLLRGATQEDKKPVRFEVSSLEDLRKEVVGVQTALKKGELESIEESIDSAIKKALPAVIAIRSIQGLQPMRAIAVYDDYQLSPPAGKITTFTSLASGVIIDGAGHILTSDKVAEAGDHFNILFDDGTQQFADLVAFDKTEHLALLKLREANASISLARFDEKPLPQAGVWLIRLGRSPTGNRSVSLGMVSIIRRDASGLETFLLDSATAPEQDGCPALNLEGEITGINIRQPQNNGGGQGLVIPIAHALKVARRLATETEPTPQSWIGLELQELSEDLCEYFKADQGALISLVKSGSPAQRAGLREMDLIVRCNDQSVTTAKQLIDVINSTAPGTRLKLAIRRNGSERLYEVVTLPYRNITEQTETESDESEQTLVLEPDRQYPDRGVKLKTIRPAALAARLGLQADDVIIAVDRRRLESDAELQRLQQRKADGEMQLW
ncbi:MAG: PDZ domain-containing protein, partial [Blastocatellia bacterium]|nr:PDZ domain-containing protein [Blastocatellia bacterium]